jgi:hypothetical protein
MAQADACAISVKKGVWTYAQQTLGAPHPRKKFFAKLFYKKACEARSAEREIPLASNSAGVGEFDLLANQRGRTLAGGSPYKSERK